MPALTKEELSDKLNNMLGLDINFSKMTKTDLQALFNKIEEKLAVVSSGAVSSDLFRRPIKDLISGKELGDLTLLDLLQELLPARKGKGLFGFGILPIDWAAREKKKGS